MRPLEDILRRLKTLFQLSEKINETYIRCIPIGKQNNETCHVLVRFKNV